MSIATLPDGRPTWEDTWMDVARVVGRRSRCVRRQVGAVVVNYDNRLIATGYAGPPAKWKAVGLCSQWCPRSAASSNPGASYHDCISIHAETNALLFVDRDSANGGTLFSTSVPCWACAKMISNSGLVRVVFEIDHVNDAHRNPLDAIKLMRDCGMIIVERNVEGTS